MSLPDITLLRPLWLLALPALAGVGWALWHRQGALGGWRQAADPELLAAMARLGHVDGGGARGPLALLLASGALVALGLAGPAIERRDALSFRNLDGVVFVIDAAPEMTASPAWTDMLTLGRFAIGALGTRPGAIVVYAGDAYVATDMTLDHLQLGQTLSLIGPETVPDDGQRPERALALAGRLLDEAQVIAGDVILLTDGGGLGRDALREGAALAERDARLSVVAPEAGPQIAALAGAGRGQVFTPDAVEALRAFLQEDARTRLERQEIPLLFWRDLGRYFVIAALVPLALTFRRVGA